MNDYGALVGTSDSLYGFLCAIRLEYRDAGGTAQHIRLHNWSEDTITIYERDTNAVTGTAFGDQTFVAYPFQVPGITTQASATLPTLQVQFPLTNSLLYMVKSNLNYVLGKPVTLYITTKDLNDLDSNNYVLFRYFLNNLAITSDMLALELNVRFNVGNITVPRRTIKRNYCPHVYKDGINCPYNPDHADFINLEIQDRCWDANGNPITEDADSVAIGTNTGTSSVSSAVAYAITADICGKTLRDCKLRKVATATHDSTNAHLNWDFLPFGGFPAVPSRDTRKLS